LRTPSYISALSDSRKSFEDYIYCKDNVDIKHTEEPPTALYYLLLQTTTKVITMLEIQLSVTDWLSHSSSIILTEKKLVYGKRNRLSVYSEICPPPHSHYSGRTSKY